MSDKRIKRERERLSFFACMEESSRRRMGWENDLERVDVWQQKEMKLIEW